MAQTGVLEPPIDAVFETETIGFDYGMVLAPGETLVSVEQMLCGLVSGVDANPSSRLIGLPQILESGTTGALRAEVRQKIGGMLAGCCYAVQCVAVTTDGQHLSLQALVPVEDSVVVAP